MWQVRWRSRTWASPPRTGEWQAIRKTNDIKRLLLPSTRPPLRSPSPGDGGSLRGSTEHRQGRWVDICMTISVMQTNLQHNKAAYAALPRRIATGEAGAVPTQELRLRHGSVMGPNPQGYKSLVPSHPTQGHAHRQAMGLTVHQYRIHVPGTSQGLGQELREDGGSGAGTPLPRRQRGFRRVRCRGQSPGASQ